jgi:hypothetical protein
MPLIRRPQNSDAAWIITLWHALHGADASIEDVAAEVTAIFSQYLPGGETVTSFEFDVSFDTVAALDDKGLRQALAVENDAISAFDLAVEREKANELRPESGQETCANESTDSLSIHHFYFKFKGRTYCFDLPALTCSPAAA